MERKGFQSNETVLCDTVLVTTCYYIIAKTHRIPRVNVNYGLWWMNYF